MATDTSLGTSPEQVITPTVDMAHAVLQAAAETPTVRRVVFTSSAATLPRLHEPVHITSSTSPRRRLPFYDQGRQQQRRHYHHESPHHLRREQDRSGPRLLGFHARGGGEPMSFVLNTVVPMTCLGAFVHPRLVSSMNGMLLGTWRGDPEAGAVMQALGVQCHVDLEDLGLLHLAALTLEDVRESASSRWAMPPATSTSSTSCARSIRGANCRRRRHRRRRPSRRRRWPRWPGGGTGSCWLGWVKRSLRGWRRVSGRPWLGHRPER
ncbi:hypothetical protein PG991_000502 [Apiospora marii]|uniref:NAD-dependent epimerase/dehydratase domain-containing protein n=1 Tax=Apiospora marii TaxID=335849 RepID=A0ABR1T4A3_9PEZI